MAPTRRRAIATQALILQIVVVVASVLTVGVVSSRFASREYDRLYGERVLSIAKSVAALSTIRDAFDDVDPASTIQPIAESFRKASGSDFVVVANREQIRYSHPEPEKIGQKLSTDASDVLQGETFVGSEHGSLGRSVRGKTPIYGDNGEVIGIVSVGILQESISAILWRYFVNVMAYIGGASLLLGGLGSYFISRRVRRQTYDLDESGLASLLEQRVAVLNGIKEGVIAFDEADRVTVLNNNAADLLGISMDGVGKHIDELGLEGSALLVLKSRDTRVDELVESGGLMLIANSRPALVGASKIGRVITLRDQTELQSLQSELHGMKTTSAALRAQAHEFSNRLHTIAGLLALEAYDEAEKFTAGATRAQALLVESVTDRITEPSVAALLIAKAVAAREYDAEVIVTAESHLDAEDFDDPSDLNVVLGNLIDNGLQALQGGGWVEVSVQPNADGVVIEVSDSGIGVDPAIADRMFETGVSTKADTRGLGLALVRRVCERRNGSVTLSSAEGTVFRVDLPRIDHQKNAVTLTRVVPANDDLVVTSQKAPL
jgi:two-component system, CitB family, sensor kinase